MSTSKQWSMTADETRLSILLRDAADLDLQSYELNKLRYRVRQAQRKAASGPDIRSLTRSRQNTDHLTARRLHEVVHRLDLFLSASISGLRGDIRSPLKL